MGAVSEGGLICRVVLPHYSPSDLADLLAFEHPDSRRDDEAFTELAELTRGYFNGQAVSFDDVAIRLPGAFAGAVLQACRHIPYGETTNYGRLAATIGREDAARAVATALGKNAAPLIVPCHRVIYAGGDAGGFSAAGGVDLKRRMLALEAAGS